MLKSFSFEADHGHSQKLLPAVERLLSESAHTLDQVELFAVVTGPGSFTGLRVSLACVRGLAGDRPCFGAVATDVAAWAARGRAPRILALTDLFHGEVFGALYDDQGHLISRHESGDAGAVLRSLTGSMEGGFLAVGSASLRHRATIEAAHPEARFLDLPEGLAPHLALLASVRATAETRSHSSDLLPFYLRDPLTRGLLATPPKTR